jgi:hypothetical protein
MAEPRKPIQQEICQLASYLHNKGGYGKDFEEAKAKVEETCVAVFDDYVTDCPGYAGKLMMVVWGAGPELYEVFVWRGGEITRIDQDPNLRREEKELRQQER